MEKKRKIKSLLVLIINSFISNVKLLIIELFNITAHQIKFWKTKTHYLYISYRIIFN